MRFRTGFGNIDGYQNSLVRKKMLQSHNLQSGEDLEATLDHDVLLYDQQLSQSTLNSKTPLQETKDWHTLKLELVKKTAIPPSGMGQLS